MLGDRPGRLVKQQAATDYRTGTHRAKRAREAATAERELERFPSGSPALRAVREGAFESVSGR